MRNLLSNINCTPQRIPPPAVGVGRPVRGATAFSSSRADSSFQPIDPRRDLGASSGVAPLFEKGSFDAKRATDSPRGMDSQRRFLNDYWSNFSSNNGQRQVEMR